MVKFLNKDTIDNKKGGRRTSPTSHFQKLYTAEVRPLYLIIPKNEKQENPYR
jgi:hypothetical protein